MRKKNLTPYLFGVKATSRRPPLPEVTCVVRGRFAISKSGEIHPHEDQGALSGDVYADGDTERTGALERASDFADFKPRGDVLLTGLCYAPGGVPTAECPIRLKVEDRLSLDRWVIGPRVWTRAAVGAAFTDPLPFKTMPIGWANAFGGEGFADNPSGKGAGGPELPNVEWPERLRGPSDRPEPACTGPVSPAWPSRARKVGKAYGKAWAKERSPYYAEDLDWTYFQAAPAAQQLDEYLRGDEALTLVNLHPDAAVLALKLPAERIRVFLRSNAGSFQEVPLRLDTLHIASDEASLYLTWRGVGASSEIDLSDLAFGIIAREPLHAEPLAVAHYESMMAGFVDDPLGMRDAVPAEIREIMDALEKAPKPADPSLDPVSRLIEEKLGHIAPDKAAALVGALRAVMGASRAEVEKAAAAAKEAGKPPPPPLDEALARAAKDASAPGRGFPGSAGDKPRVELSGSFATLRESVDQVRRATEEAHAAGAKKVEGLERLDQVDQALRDPRLVALDPSLAGEPVVEPGPDRDLSGRDFSGRDLSGMDLSRANLSGANLSGANLSGATLPGANLRRAILLDAVLDGADLTRADLSMVIGRGASMRGARLVASELTRAILLKVDLTGATLDDASGAQCLLAGARLERASAKGVSFTLSDLSDSDLAGADFSGARLPSCFLTKARAAGACFEGAHLGKASFADADLERCRFVGARGEGPSFIGAKLSGADFTGAVLPKAHFSEAKGSATVFRAAHLRDARFYKAELEHAVFERADLYGAELGRAVVSGSTFRDASLYDAKLVGTGGKGCDFVGANLKRSTLEGA